MKDIILSELEFSLFQKLIQEKCGIDIAPDKAYLIESRLMRILVELGFESYSQLYQYILKESDDKLIDKLISAITTNETLWFRDKSPWEVLKNLYLPKYIEMLRSGEKSKIRIWSAAASSGQEAYSTAICIDNYLKTKFIKDITLDHFEIIATDISRPMLEIARSGRYNNIAMNRGMDENLKHKYFTQSGNVWEIIPEMKAAVKFTQFNLQNSFIFMGQFDIIFCRYVLIYFLQSLIDDTLYKLSTTLKEDGVLFIGNYEFSPYLSKYFNSVSDTLGHYYTRKEASK
ncbi:MAG: CheR family methyltransferase [Anaerotignaceae bacterium]